MPGPAKSRELWPEGVMRGGLIPAKRVQTAVGAQQSSGVLRANAAASKSRARYIFVAPPEPDPAYAWIGGWEWLSPVAAEAGGVSVCARELTVMSQLAHTTAALLESENSRLSAMPDVWKEIAERLDRQRFLTIAFLMTSGRTLASEARPDGKKQSPMSPWITSSGAGPFGPNSGPRN